MTRTRRTAVLRCAPGRTSAGIGGLLVAATLLTAPASLARSRDVAPNPTWQSSADVGRASATRTPDECIRLNDGDWNACNVGNTGAGDKPYARAASVPRTPDGCIWLNLGDWNAGNVGNTGAGDKPYAQP
jgi:hypothetical protein